MRVISMVPSITETLLECDIDVVGRTRFCIHPKDRVKNIPIVGGTKDLNWQKIKDLNADLLIVDKEENLPWMQSDAPLPVWVMHVTKIADMGPTLRHLSAKLSNPKLGTLAAEWETISTTKNRGWDWQKVPATLEVWRREHSNYKNIVYVIWKNPWMAVGQETFIGSVLEKLGARLLPMADKYPKFELSHRVNPETLFLFSSEPFPFHKFKDEVLQTGAQCLLVDGESYSWFGIRSLRFLQKVFSS